MNPAVVKARAQALGFSACGIVPAQPSPHLDAYLRWIDAGMHGTMGYMARPDRVARRRDLNLILPGARSLIVAALDYGGAIPASILTDPRRGRIAAYAWGVDYHELILPRLHQLADAIAAPYKAYVDTGAILERSHAQGAGMGFIGKNTMLIHPRRGGSFFLGEIITTAPFDDYDRPGRATMCGKCTRCLTACPTDAFPAPYILDARRCISCLTIEHKTAIDPDLRPLMGNWVFGCDICQDVCPFQRFAPGATDPAFLPIDADRAAPPLADLLALDAASFAARFAGTPIARIGRDRLVRNACIAAGNSAQPDFIPLLRGLEDDPAEIVRDAAAWGLSRLAV
jgi:epoxyqueuosine reductase